MLSLDSNSLRQRLLKNESLLRLVRRLYHVLRVNVAIDVLHQLRVSRAIGSIRLNYAQTLKRVRGRLKAGLPIRVVFVVSDDTKWKLQSVYDRLRNDARFEVRIVTSLYGWHDDKTSAERRMKQVAEFFVKRSMPIKWGYSIKEKRAVSLREFDPDIVFYDQPWDILPEHEPLRVSAFALTCYVPYAVDSVEMRPANCASPFYREIFRYFLESKAWVDAADRVRGNLSIAGKLVPVGHPMLDLIQTGDASYRSRTIIYAPHWSFPHPNNPNDLGISTFIWTGDAILDFARNHRQFRWVFKPHPVLKMALVKAGVMTDAQVSSYYSAWAELGECYERGDYIHLFNESSALITDCGSFLTEYACTGHPIVHLLSPKPVCPPCQISQPLFSTYYQVRTLAELEPVLESVVVRGEDPNREVRLAAAKELNLLGTDAAGNIVRHLEELLSVLPAED